MSKLLVLVLPIEDQCYWFVCAWVLSILTSTKRSVASVGQEPIHADENASFSTPQIRNFPGPTPITIFDNIARKVLTTCRHEHLVPLLGVCLDPTPMLVYPFVGKSLEWHLKEPERRAALDWRKRLSVALAVSKGLQVGLPTI